MYFVVFSDTKMDRKDKLFVINEVRLTRPFSALINITSEKVINFYFGAFLRNHYNCANFSGLRNKELQQMHLF